MPTAVVRSPAALIPAQPQRLWGWPAVLNFTLGGMGAGLYATAVLAAGLGRPPAVAWATWIAPLLVLAGFAAVAGEAGRPLRGPRVLWRVRTSWMSRELWLGGAFVLFAVADIAFPLRLHRAQALVAAALFVVAQGFILRCARGVAAWNVARMPWLFALSAAVSGVGLYLVLEAVTGRPIPETAFLAGIAVLVVSLQAGRAYLATPAGHAFRDATGSFRDGLAGRVIVGVGLALPAAALAVALVAPAAITAPAALAAGLAMIAGQVSFKAELILRAGLLRPITVASLRMPRRPS